MARKVPPPDFRYVWLTPGSGQATLAVGAAAAAAGAGALIAAASHHSFAGQLILAVGVCGLAALAPRAAVAFRAGVHETVMAIVPWGVLVTPDTEPRVLRWPAIQRVSVDAVHSMNGGTPAVLASVVTVDTGRELLAGRTSGPAGLEALVANLDAYAEEASRPVALDLDGLAEAGDGATEPVMADLLREAGDLCSTGRGAAILGLPPGGYRSIAGLRAGPETLALLRAVLGASAPGPADARPLAAIVAAMLGASALLPDLLRLVSSPHPVVAAVAKAAALRLGAPQSRAGAVDEVSAFLFADDLARIERWALGDVEPLTSPA